ncbi:tRNA (cytosine(72)-C(5))-methyltransferase NSUN6 [Eupeodes corollae]|uniref:tRNA (cytosine(72)-C(5))-methyltransferase NSUN6 n=1 Tax=Eupeodes corollae TaxID=290404 RepID=UPI0024904190|nr:tRNA (cytosine(72)-C(5))-methyltransferase NSUN6 [Eupeodes corollae]
MFYPKSPFIKNQLVESQLFSRNPSGINTLLEWMCRTPSTTTYRINPLLSSITDFSAKLQAILSTKYKNTPKIFSINGIPEVICISKLDEVPKLPSKDLKEVMVDSSCGAAVLRGAHIFAPGVLSMQSGTKLGEMVNVFVDLEGKCKKGTSIVFESEQKVFIGTGEVKMQRYQLYGENIANHGIAIEMLSNISGVPSIGDLSSKDALLQNFPSIVCVRVLDPQPNELILDMCAAPGNKTTHIVELMGDTGTVIALDKTENKVDLIRQKIEINGIKSIKAFAFDSTKLLHESINDSKLDNPPFGPCKFDRILLDAPCSAIGNRPLLSSNITPKMLKSYPNVQKKLLRNAVGLLKKNGVLVYSTCSVTEDENEGMVKWVLEQFPEMILIEAVPIFGGPGIKEAGGLTEEQRHLVQRFGPTEYNRGVPVDSIGFFIAKFVKIS